MRGKMILKDIRLLIDIVGVGAIFTAFLFMVSYIFGDRGEERE